VPFEGSGSATLSPRLDQIFDFEGYVDEQARQREEIEESARDFFETFASTQLFNTFLERSYRISEFHDPCINYFLDCLDLLYSENQAAGFEEVFQFQSTKIDYLATLIYKGGKQIDFKQL